MAMPLTARRPSTHEPVHIPVADVPDVNSVKDLYDKLVATQTRLVHIPYTSWTAQSYRFARTDVMHAIGLEKTNMVSRSERSKVSDRIQNMVRRGWLRTIDREYYYFTDTGLAEYRMPSNSSVKMRGAGRHSAQHLAVVSN